MGSNIIVTTPEELQAIIEIAIEKILPKLADFRRNNEAKEIDVMTIDEASQFLTDQGIPTKRNALYNLIYKNAVPRRKVGRRVVFSKKELLSWIDQRTTHPANGRRDTALMLAASAKRRR